MELSQSSVNVITGFLLVLYLLAVLEHGYIRDILNKVITKLDNDSVRQRTIESYPVYLALKRLRRMRMLVTYFYSFVGIGTLISIFYKGWRLLNEANEDNQYGVEDNNTAIDLTSILLEMEIDWFYPVLLLVMLVAFAFVRGELRSFEQWILTLPSD